MITTRNIPALQLSAYYALPTKVLINYYEDKTKDGNLAHGIKNAKQNGSCEYLSRIKE